MLSFFNRKKFKPKVYIKDNSNDPIFKQVNKEFLVRTRIIPAVLPALGLFLMGSQVILPLISFTTQDDTAYAAEASALGRVAGFNDFEFSELETRDRVLGKSTYNTNPAQTNSLSQDDGIVPEYFSISIPKLKIENALVETNAISLRPDNAIGHYPQSALPGGTGNTFLFGHSVLPFFYNPKNYKTIFSKIDKLSAGDLIYVEYKDSLYTYKVEGKRELKPDKVDPLAEIKPKFLNDSTLVLMTCSPMGTKINRYLVDSVLIDTKKI